MTSKAFARDTVLVVYMEDTSRCANMASLKSFFLLFYFEAFERT